MGLSDLEVIQSAAARILMNVHIVPSLTRQSLFKLVPESFT